MLLFNRKVGTCSIDFVRRRRRLTAPYLNIPPTVIGLVRWRFGRWNQGCGVVVLPILLPLSIYRKYFILQDVSLHRSAILQPLFALASEFMAHIE